MGDGNADVNYGLEFWDEKCRELPRSTSYIRIIMGDFVDYFRPKDSYDFCDMLTSKNKHDWSSDGINWVILKETDYDRSQEPQLGGSSATFARDGPIGRDTLSMWGYDHIDAKGGCCYETLDEKQTF